jgi:hypothetical protein
MAQGRLVLPFSQVIELDLHYHLILPEARAQEPLIGRFREWLLREAAEFRGVLAGHARKAA